MTTLERITASLNMLGMAPAQLAEQANIPLHIVSQYLKGEATPSEAELQAMGYALQKAPQNIHELHQLSKSDSPKVWLVVEVCERELGEIVQFPTQEAAIKRANEMLKAHAENIGYGDEFFELKADLDVNPDADEDSYEIHIAPKGREGAWCNWHDTHWDAFVVQLEGILSRDAATQAVYQLLDENKPNLEDKDLYAQGYHDALLDILDGLKLPRDPKYGDHFD